MTSGYDKRTRLSDPIDFLVRSKDTNLLKVKGHFQTSSEEVISFRDNVRGTRLEASDVDIYSGFFNRDDTLADYLNPGPRLLSQLEASGLAQPSDYKSLDGRGLDNGHPFQATKQSVTTSLRNTNQEWLGFNLTPPSACKGGPIYHGGTAITSAAGPKMPFKFSLETAITGRSLRSRDGIPAPDASDLESYGTKAIGLCAPGVPSVSVTTSVGELLLGLPSIPGYSLLKSGAFGTSGSEYLNIVFGIIPTLSDAKQLGKILSDLSMHLYQFRRDIGKRVRRNFVYPVQQVGDIFDSTEFSACNLFAGNTGQVGFKTNYDVPGGSSSTGSLGDFRSGTQLFMLETREIWFSGSFTYFLPELPGFSGRIERYMSEYDRLLGLTMDSSAAWQLMPWSWLIDWFTDISENLAAIQIAHDDNLVMNYGYAMDRSKRTVIMKTVFNPPSPRVNLGGSTFLNTMWETTSKRRIRANPYGFVSSADEGVWTPYRLAVLAALGISR